MKKAVISVMLFTIVAKLLGFTREILLSYFLGATGVSDAYLISLTIPGTIFQFVGTSLATCFIPVFLGILKKEDVNRGNDFTNCVLSLILLFSSAVIVVIWRWGDAVVKLFASGFTGETFELAVLFTKISVCSLYISTFVYVFNSLLQSYDCFTPVAFAAIPNSIVVMISIILGAKVNILFLPIGNIVAIFIQMLVLVPYVRRNHFKLSLNMHFSEPHMKDMYRLILPVIFGVSVNEINVLVDKTIASGIAEGGISALSYANSLIMFVQGIFAQTIATVYYPTITRLVEEKEYTKLQKTIAESIGSMLFLLLPVMVGCILVANTIVSVLYGRGAFDINAVKMTAESLFGYAIGVLGYGVREVLARVFYAMHDTKTPTRNATIGVIINILMNLVFSKFIGLRGLALATSVSSIITSLLLLWDLKKSGMNMLDDDFRADLWKMVLASMVMGAEVWYIHRILVEGNELVNLLIMVGAGGSLYILLAYIFRVNIAVGICQEIKQKIRGSK